MSFQALQSKAQACTGRVQTGSFRNLSFEQGHQHTLQTRLFSYLQAICCAVFNRKHSCQCLS